MNEYVSDIEREFLRLGICTAADLAGALGISQPTLSRALAAFPPGRLHRIGRGRSTRYALHQRFEGLGDHWPLYQIDEKGEASQVAVLHALQRGAWHVEQAHPWQTLRGSLFPDGVYPGWPWFLDDLRPQGFLGRLFARRFSVAYRVPDDARLWTPEHILSALVRKGDDLPGAFVVGDDMLRIARQQRERCISREERTEAYARLAAKVLEGNWPGSSAAGEQPKFIATVEGHSGEVCPVIVKFSGDVNDPGQARRADLLIAEHWANESLRAAGIPAAKTEILFHQNRSYLESVRFDRTSVSGRRHVVSLLVFDAAYYGDLSSPWYQAARRLERDGFLGAESAERMRIIWWFGQCIGNTDMHYGNLSLYLEPDWPLSLAPVYDMSPMALHPRSDGSLPDGLPEIVLPPPEEVSAYEKARSIAEDYRARVLSDSRVSSSFKAIVNGFGGTTGVGERRRML
ncbi:MAG: type II toxin-antitoxin system HipA family toxin YjjJ [Kiritimatiellia bacterium]